MKFLVFKVFIFCLLSTSLYAQYNISGIVKFREDSLELSKVVIYLNEGKISSETNTKGEFLFKNLKNGNYDLHFTGEKFRYQKLNVTISDRDQHRLVYLETRIETLNEVIVTNIQSDFGMTRMKSVESMGIYEGKKSEVIIPEQLVANLATNNARQIYSKVPGLNIWENDGAGLQLSIGGRGLDPNRTSNFNTRQNGYDISADALGYPESYYTPPIEGVGRIQIVRGAASLQYGTQFGGLINFSMKKPVQDKKIELLVRQSAGSFGFYNSFTSLSGTIKKLSYYTFFQYKRGDGWRKNSHFYSHTFYSNINYAINERTKIGFDITQMGYLAQQPGGLSDRMFKENPRQSNRERNWFKVNWNLLALHLDHQLTSSSDFNLKIFGLYANRYSVGFRPNRVDTIDHNGKRDLIKGDFKNWGVEARILKRCSIRNMSAVFLLGSRYYSGFNQSTQGDGSANKFADFRYKSEDENILNDYSFPNQNISVFAENIFFLTKKLSFIPGIRFEYINTTAKGYYRTTYNDLAGNFIKKTKTDENRNNARQLIIAGLGVSYKPTSSINLYSNISQNYRSITFSDIRISNPSSTIDPNIKDERGYSFDLGIRSEHSRRYNYDISLFHLNYNNRIGEVPSSNENNDVLRRRGNIGQAVIRGLEAYGEIDFLGYLLGSETNWSGVVFNNVAIINSIYKRSEITGVKGKKVEFVPTLNTKSGIRIGYSDLKVSFQHTYLSKQFTDARNSIDGGISAVTGLIPSYSIMDLSLSYQFKMFQVETSINNLANKMYYTRRATGYPGPGILPSDGRSFYLTLQVKL